MKRLMTKGAAIFLVLLALIPGVSGCDSREQEHLQGENPSKGAETVQEVQEGQDAQDAQEDEPPEADIWSKQELETLFSGIRQQDWEFADCVAFPDNAYDCVGAVLFWDENKCGAAFLEADGSFQTCTIGAKPEDELGLTYLGDGTISFFLEGEDGSPCEWTLSIRVDGENVMFKPHSEDGQQSPEESLS